MVAIHVCPPVAGTPLARPRLLAGPSLSRPLGSKARFDSRQARRVARPARLARLACESRRAARQ